MTRERDEKNIDPTINNKENGGWKNGSTLSSRDDFYYFIEFIYKNCKNLGIKSPNVIEWIQDLLDFVSLSSENVATNSTRFEKNIDRFDELQNLNTNKKLVFRKSVEIKNEKGTHIPLVSEISGYIKQKKLDLQHLNLYNEKLQEEIKDLDEQKNTIISNINHLKRKESLSLTYLDWFYSLKEELWDNYRIELEKEFNNFVKVYIDFKYYDYNAHQIVQEYKQIESLREEIKSLQSVVDSVIKTRDDTLKEIKSLAERENYSRQSLDVLQELFYAGFNLKELKQLRNTIIEIAESNKVRRRDAVAFFPSLRLSRGLICCKCRG
jgi:hypothetical protein